jgi:hypothetical protein
VTDLLTCTEKLQEWNRPKAKKVEILPVDELTALKQDIHRIIVLFHLNMTPIHHLCTKLMKD